MNHAPDIAIGVRDFWNRRPCNIRHSTEAIGSKEYLMSGSAQYFVEPHIPMFAEFQRWKGKRVLEIAADRDGHYEFRSRRCRGNGGRSKRKIPRDYSPACLRLWSLKYSILPWQCGTAHFVIPAGGYDLIYSFGVIHHTPHPERVIEQLRLCSRRARH